MPGRQKSSSIGRWQREPGRSILRAVEQKPIAEVDDQTLILADMARKAQRQVRQTVIDTAERLVREEIERIKRHARASGGGPQTGR